MHFIRLEKTEARKSGSTAWSRQARITCLALPCCCFSCRCCCSWQASHRCAEYEILVQCTQSPGSQCHVERQVFNGCHMHVLLLMMALLTRDHTPAGATSISCTVLSTTLSAQASPANTFRRVYRLPFHHSAMLWPRRLPCWKILHLPRPAW